MLTLILHIATSAECEVGIFLELVEKCAYDSRYNAGSINMAVLPTRESQGRPETEGTLMYAMGPQPLNRI